MKLHLIAFDPVYIRNSVLPEVEFLREKERSVSCSGPFQQKQQEHLERLSASFLPLEVAVSPRFFAGLSAAWALYGFLKKERPDAVVAFDAHAAAIGFWVAAFLGIPVRLFRADSLPTVPLGQGWNGLWGSFLLRALRRHTSSAWASESLAARKLSQAPFGPLPLKKNTFFPSYGLHIPRLLEEANKENHLVAMTMRLQVSENDFVLLHWGPLGRQSGIEALLDAFITLPQRCKLVCVGLGQRGRCTSTLSTSALRGSCSGAGDRGGQSSCGADDAGKCARSAPCFWFYACAYGCGGSYAAYYHGGGQYTGGLATQFKNSAFVS
ncbi:group 1 glycosyl transferase [Nitritalea halalkaliphila LW7]|uniref:Group 1 glycosyl transferase n=1 Tax=Nitritalea halalkaliphila LW7 TaxID=1189621 RepID=I5C3K0_9BACT|nr:glycosyltransferase [Nitritalea halalkaliphila]EIM76402.1 group 1 glycosyl transferase [Nitritalea halalkaliphila LW7]